MTVLREIKILTFVQVFPRFWHHIFFLIISVRLKGLKGLNFVIASFSGSVTDLELSPLFCFQISLGLITAKATHVVYPRWKRLESIDVSDGRVIKEHERLNIWTLATLGWIVICYISNDNDKQVTDVLLLWTLWVIYKFLWQKVNVILSIYCK